MYLLAINVLRENEGEFEWQLQPVVLVETILCSLKRESKSYIQNEIINS